MVRTKLIYNITRLTMVRVIVLDIVQLHMLLWPVWHCVNVIAS